MEKTVIDTCSHFGIQSHTTPDTGVWVGNNKIAAIGKCVHHTRMCADTHTEKANRNSCQNYVKYCLNKVSYTCKLKRSVLR